jgi:hypothetical protein
MSSWLGHPASNSCRQISAIARSTIIVACLSTGSRDPDFQGLTDVVFREGNSSPDLSPDGSPNGSPDSDSATGCPLKIRSVNEGIWRLVAPLTLEFTYAWAYHKRLTNPGK